MKRSETSSSEHLRRERLGRVAVEALVVELGITELIRRLAHPFWLGLLGGLLGEEEGEGPPLGVLAGLLKRGLDAVADELGLTVIGGDRPGQRETQSELKRLAARRGFDSAPLAHALKLSAKVDELALQDGYSVLSQVAFISRQGEWAVINEACDPTLGLSRRYGWCWERPSFVSSPHLAVAGEPTGQPILHLVHEHAAAAQAELVALTALPLAALTAEVAQARRAAYLLETLPLLALPRRGSEAPFELGEALKRLTEAAPSGFEALLLTPGVGRESVAALALVVEVLRGHPTRFADPARPLLSFPIPPESWEDTLAHLKRTLSSAKLGQDEKLKAIRRLDDQARLLEAARELEGKARRRPRSSGRKSPKKKLDPRQEALPGLFDDQ